MATASDALRKAAGEIGYYAPADPLPGSKYGRWEADKLGQPWLSGPSTSIWWCMIFVSWVMDGLADVPALPGFNCDTVKGAAQAAGMLVNVRDAQPGDIVLYDWNGNGSLDHTGIVELNMGPTGVQAIEGNTSGSDGTNQSNGNGVWRRTRSWQYVAAVIRPNYIADAIAVANVVAAVPTVAPAPVPSGPVIVAPGIPAPPYPLPAGYYFGPKSGPVQSVSGFYSHRSDLARWQQRMKDRGWAITADGLYGNETAGVAHDFQVEKGLGVDSLIGPETWGAAWTAPVTR